MKTTWPILVPVILLALIGAYISYNLMLKHEVSTTGLKWFDAVCEGDDDIASNRSCDEVVRSKWGTFPPIPPDTPDKYRYEPQPVLGYFDMRPRSVSLFGMLYFSALATWYIGVGRPSYKRRWLHLVPLLFNLLGVAGAGFFVYVMFFGDLEAWCPWCMIAHLVNGLMLVGAVLLWPRKPAPSAQAAGDNASPAVDDLDAESAVAPPRQNIAVWSPAQPSARLVVVTLGAMLAVVTAEWFFHEFAWQFRLRSGVEAQYAKLEMEMDQIMAHGETLYNMYLVNEKKEIPIRDDDPVKNAGVDRLSLVVFSDFRCPHCGRFARYLNKALEPMFDGGLKIVFKHYPADTSCNDHLKHDMHPGACQAAAAAEAARILGGNEAFWQAHDLLFAAKQVDQASFYPELAKSLGLDADRFAEVMASPEVLARIKEDIELGRKIGLRGTPALYLSGRLVPSICRQQEAFWNEVKSRYEYLLKLRQEQRAQQDTQPAEIDTQE